MCVCARSTRGGGAPFGDAQKLALAPGILLQYPKPRFPALKSRGSPYLWPHHLAVPELDARLGFRLLSCCRGIFCGLWTRGTVFCALAGTRSTPGGRREDAARSRDIRN
jgi:hypothetical protein